MTGLAEPVRVAAPVADGRWSGRWQLRWAVPAAVLGVVLLRLPLVWTDPAPDEAGYLLIARQWHAGGTSLYGSYWVDRPPFLLMLFQVASALGGVPGLRLLGCVAAAVTVLATSYAGRRLGGPRAAAWCAVLGAAFLVSPLLGAAQVNGELLAAPFSAVAVACAVVALQEPRARRFLAAAAAAGAAAAGALLVKQNMADAVVFALVAWAVAWRSRTLSGRRLVRMLAAAAAGGVLVAGVVAAWSVAHGTSIPGVLYAMYPFRIRAAQVMAASPSAVAGDHVSSLVEVWFLSGMPLLMLAFVAAVLRRRVGGPAVWALLADLCFATTSVLAGGSFWRHYLIEFVVPTALAVGLLVGARLPAMRGLVVLVTGIAVVAWGVGALSTRSDDVGTIVGASIARVAHPHDTMVSLFGDASVALASGLRSPYPYLWSLPARTLDPRFHSLQRLLNGSRAPTWVVVENHRTYEHLRAAPLRSTLGVALRSRYHSVADVCGRRLYLHDGVHRPVPRHATACRIPGSVFGPVAHPR